MSPSPPPPSSISTPPPPSTVSTPPPPPSASMRLSAHTDILARIFAHALRSPREIVVPDWGTTTIKRGDTGIATGLLALNHEWYHRNLSAFFRENDFVVGGHGGGLRLLLLLPSLPLLPGQQPREDNSGICCSGAVVCHHHHHHHYQRRKKKIHLRSLRLVLGSPDHDLRGVDLCAAFISALKGLPPNNAIRTSRLHIHLLPFCFLNDKDLAAFAFALREKVEVEHRLQLSGLDVHWEWSLGLVPLALGMRMQPVRCEFVFHDDKAGKMGPFACGYVRARSEEERLGRGDGGKRVEVRDGRWFYERGVDGVYDEGEGRD
ncbi:MAG: hypothetical protein Q9219_001520 [cf. Caloplaca sp. 3 TL-2023]